MPPPFAAHATRIDSGNRKTRKDLAKRLGLASAVRVQPTLNQLERQPWPRASLPRVCAAHVPGRYHANPRHRSRRAPPWSTTRSSLQRNGRFWILSLREGAHQSAATRGVCTCCNVPDGWGGGEHASTPATVFGYAEEAIGPNPCSLHGGSCMNFLVMSAAAAPI